jgi:hypothetical protein
LNIWAVRDNARILGALMTGLLAGAPGAVSADETRGWNYGSNGWQWSDPGSGSLIWFGLRFQLRYSNRVDEPLVPEDLRGTWKPAVWFNLRAGQWKAEFNRERVDSSGKQQFVDRSIANYWFTVDRQNGVMASGRPVPLEFRRRGAAVFAKRAQGFHRAAQRAGVRFHEH